MSEFLTTMRRTAIRYLRQGGRTRTDDYVHRQRQGDQPEGQWAFIHINKCGGTSVEHALNIPKIHDTAQQRRDLLGADRWAALRSFSIVRHPYERVRSLYKYRIKTAQTGLEDAHIGLDDWIAKVFDARDPAYHDKPLMFLPARDWLTDENDRVIVDTVVKLETIDADWPKIQEIVGTDVALPKKNTTAPSGTGAAAAMSPDSMRILQHYFAADFDSFGYNA